MDGSTLYRSSTVGCGHEVSRPATHSPLLKALAPPKEDIGSSFGEEGPYDILSYDSAEHLVHPGISDQNWPIIEVTSSADSSSPSAFTPVEGTASPASFAGVPIPDTLNPPRFVNATASQLHSLTGPKAGMQSPASFYPNSPSDSFGGSDVHELRPHAISAFSSASQADAVDMDVTSAPTTATRDPARPNTGDKPYAQLLRDCFLSRPDYSMSLKEIYAWFERNTTKANQSGNGWQNSIRHNLSMNRAFKKQDATHLSASTNKAPSRPRTNVWTMEDWAVHGRVHSTTRYRKSNSGRRSRPGHRNSHSQGLGLAGGHYVLAGGVNSPNRGMNRAAAGRRGGVATAQARERRRAEDQEHKQQDIVSVQQHPLSMVDTSSSSWAVPRAGPDELGHSYAMGGNLRMAGDTPGVHGYVGFQGGVPMGSAQMYDYSMPEPSSSSTLPMSGLQGVVPHISSGTSHHPTSEHRHNHQQHNTSYIHGFSRNVGDYTLANSPTPTQHHPNLTSFVPNFDIINSHSHHEEPEN